MHQIIPDPLFCVCEIESNLFSNPDDMSFTSKEKKGFSQAQIVLFSKAFLTIEKASKQNKGEIELNPE